MLKVKIKKLRSDAVIPNYATDGSAGFDFVATEDITIMPGEVTLIKTGLSFEIPKGYELQIRPRSGMSLNTKLRISNSPGTIDSDYRGEVAIIMENIDSRGLVYYKCYIKKGDRVAQGVICPIIQAEFEEVTELSDTERGSGGFGHTGK